MILRDPSGKSWSVRVSVWKDGRVWISRGWAPFCKENNLGKDDKCICEFIRGRGIEGTIIQMHILRAGVAASTLNGHVKRKMKVKKRLSLSGWGLRYGGDIVKSKVSFGTILLGGSACEDNLNLPIDSGTDDRRSNPQLGGSRSIDQEPHLSFKMIVGQTTMATTSAALSPATFSSTAIAGSGRHSSQRRKNNVVYIGGLNSFGGLKAQNSVVSLGLPVCTEQSFAKVVSSLKLPSQGKGRGGGALSSTCNAVGEIFKIAAIMNGLVLVGVAVGFVLLRMEATVEEAE
ncbi:hypothetical protein HHK36_010004 [Tetracentron sinense]|uniref:TF-B3 domain-containing protein n=1 Tax=Tetracentron sinense TaxID=13715 RepID=A0A835DIV5_TETSI|nr:hypothetical protein HHK36_010004 [Tetracentron sinense]